MPLLWRSSRESRSERCKRAFLLAPICKVLLAPTLVSDRASFIPALYRNRRDAQPPKPELATAKCEHGEHQRKQIYLHIENHLLHQIWASILHFRF